MREVTTKIYRYAELSEEAQEKARSWYREASRDERETEEGDVPVWDSTAEHNFEEAARDCMRWIYHRLEKEYDWQNADEQVAENIEANEYEFTEEGEIA